MMRSEAPGALWTGIGCFILTAAIVFGFGLMIIEQLPGPGP